MEKLRAVTLLSVGNGGKMLLEEKAWRWTDRRDILRCTWAFTRGWDRSNLSLGKAVARVGEGSCGTQLGDTAGWYQMPHRTRSLSKWIILACLLTYVLTHSTQHSPSWEANQFSA